MQWKFRDINPDLAGRLARELGQPQKLGEFLAARGFKTAAEVRAFVRADFKDLPPPSSLTDMDKAVDRLTQAWKNGELTAVCGDYDADGLTATALLAGGLKALKHQIVTRIPHRLTDGYGLKPPLVEKMAADGVKLAVTVDNGISAHEAVEAASALGLDIIITDHHRLPPELPPAVAIINPHRDEAWRLWPPAGVGVAFMLMAAVKKHYQNLGLVSPQEGPSLVENLPLVAIGAIADMAPLCGANRIMVRHGLDLLASSSHPGLTALKQISRLAPQNRVSPRDVGFRMAPRLNAAGRLGSADPALELLLAEDEGLARTLAARLENLNRERHQLQNRLCGEALEKLEMEARPDDRTVVLAGEGWPRGILGLAASRVAETTGKPTVLFSLENGLAVGSGRTSGKFNLYSALNASRHLYTAFGGHAQAAGLTMPAKNLDDFRISFEDAASQEGDFLEEMEHWIDFRVALGDLPALDRPLAAMEPFGQDNPQPLVMVSQAHVLDARPTDSGGESHIKMVIGDGLIRQKIIGFNLAPRLYEVGRELDVLLTPDFSEYKGQSSTQWRLVDFRLPQQ